MSMSMTYRSIAAPSRSDTQSTAGPGTQAVDGARVPSGLDQLATYGGRARVRVGTCAHELIAEQAARTPESTAVEAGGDCLTYRELDHRSNQFAHSLIARGVGRGDLVALQLERSASLVVVLLGILKAGAAYVPVDPRASEARRDRILSVCDPRILLTSADIPTDSELPTTAPAVPVSTGDAMYVIHTSGSTGEPKGVVLEHGGVANVLTWMVREYGFGPADRVLQKTPYTFDASVWEFFVPLISGGTLVLAEPDAHQDPRRLVAAVRDHAITTLQLVPLMLRHVLDEPELERCLSLRHVFCGGEELTSELQSLYFGRFPDSAVPLHNLYGPTETSIQVLAWTCRPDDPRPFVPIGRPIDNVVALVRDGQLHIGGIALARGYLGDPELTARAFTDGPDRLYRTGDLVRQHPDGVFEFLGRADDQVKVHGHRVELGAIEAHLRRIPTVRDAAVLLERNDTARSTRLVAYLRAEPGSVRLADLRRQLADRVPEYMIPAQFKVVPEFPLSAHGKLDKAALSRARTAVVLSDGSTAEAGRTDVERRLVEIWQQTLAVDPVGIHDDFFEIGGDSIAGLLMIARAKKHGIAITPKDLFKLRSISAIARESAL
ncbi:MAG: non-ribosomal peptide synthetase [Dermatophilaceae bacterium]